VNPVPANREVSAGAPESGSDFARLRRLPSLDGWRAASILMVLASHGHFIANNPRILESFFLRADSLGDLGVRFFFIISGFLISWLMLVESEANGSVNLRHFYIRRALRILPVYRRAGRFGCIYFIQAKPGDLDCEFDFHHQFRAQCLYQRTFVVVVGGGAILPDLAGALRGVRNGKKSARSAENFVPAIVNRPSVSGDLLQTVLSTGPEPAFWAFFVFQLF
jgi:hypothetical protein